MDYDKINDKKEIQINSVEDITKYQPGNYDKINVYLLNKVMSTAELSQLSSMINTGAELDINCSFFEDDDLLIQLKKNLNSAGFQKIDVLGHYVSGNWTVIATKQ
jgi:hypothetical protein